MGRMLVVIEAPHYAASIVIGRKSFNSGVVVLEAAPILKWALGKSWLYCQEYFGRKGFKWSMSEDPAQARHPSEDEPSEPHSPESLSARSGEGPSQSDPEG